MASLLCASPLGAPEVIFNQQIMHGLDVREVVGLQALEGTRKGTS